MMQTKRFIVTFLFLLAIVLTTRSTLWSQSSLKQHDLNASNIPSQTGLVRVPQFSEAKIVSTIDGMTTIHYDERSTYTVGNPYLYESFLPGTMTLKDGMVFENLPVRYNIERDIIEFIYITDTLDLINPLRISNIQFAEKEFIYSIGLIGRDRVNASFYEVLYDGGDDVKLILNYKAKLVRDEYLKNYAGGFGSGDLYYQKDEHYFILRDKGPALPVNTVKDIYKMFPDYKKEIAEYWKQENLRFKNRKDLLKVIEFISEKDH